MRGLLFGLCLGLLLAAGIGIILPRWLDQPLVTRFTPTPTAMEGAGTDANLSNTVPARQRFSLTLAVSDHSKEEVTTSAGLTSLAVTFERAEIAPENFRFPTTIPNDQWEVLNLTQPTVELMSLRGSGALAELGQTQLAAGRYGLLRLTIQSLRGRLANGHVIELPVAATNQTLLIPLHRDWPAGEDREIILDINTLAGLSTTGSTVAFELKLRGVLDNDGLLP